jgi:hypothetical protein
VYFVRSMPRCGSLTTLKPGPAEQRRDHPNRRGRADEQLVKRRCTQRARRAESRNSNSLRVNEIVSARFTTSGRCPSARRRSRRTCSPSWSRGCCVDCSAIDPNITEPIIGERAAGGRISAEPSVAILRKRRGGDSNPRTRSTPVTRFPVAPIQPLWHLSIACDARRPPKATTSRALAWPRHARTPLLRDAHSGPQPRPHARRGHDTHAPGAGRLRRGPTGRLSSAAHPSAREPPTRPGDQRCYCSPT